MKKIVALILSIITLTVVFSGCGKDKNKGDTIVVASKNYNEALILGNMFASIIENNTDLNVERKLNLGGTQVAWNALINGDVDLYPEYTGTGYVTILKQNGENDASNVYDIVSKEFDEKYDITWCKPLGFNNTYAMAVRKETADKYNLETCSDLAKISNELTLGSTFEFAERQDGYKGLQTVYNIKFKDTACVDGALRYQALDQKSSDVIDAFTTEGLLRVYDIKILEDDKNFFPPYYAAPIVRNEIVEKYPEVKEQLDRLEGLIDEETMINLNYKVDKLGEDPEKVADEFLKEKGLI